MSDRATRFIDAVRNVDLGHGYRPTVIVRADNKICLSAEEPDGLVIDPWGDMLIHPDVVAVAEQHRFDLEFESAGAIIAYAY